MVYRTITLSLAMAALFVGGSVASAEVIAQDDFEDYAQEASTTSTNQFHEYSDANRDGGSGWSGPWSVDDGQSDGTNPTLGTFITPAGLDYDAGSVSIDGGDNQFQFRRTSSAQPGLAGREFSAQTGTLYLSFLFSGDGMSSDRLQIGFTSGDVAGIGNETTLSNLFVGSLWTDLNEDAFYARSGSTGSDAHGSSYADDTVFLVVIKIEKDGSSNYNKATLFLNPTSTTETGGLSVTADTGADTVSHIGIRQTLDSFDELNLDRVVVATTFAEAIEPNPVPEPATLALLGLGGLALAGGAVRRRRRVA